MEVKHNQLEELRGKNPFKLPDGYLEGLTSQIMSQIPDDTKREPKVVSMSARIRPWLYIAAACAGLLLIIRLFVSPVNQDTTVQKDASSQMQALASGELFTNMSEEDLEYLEYIENQFFDRELAETIDNME